MFCDKGFLVKYLGHIRLNKVEWFRLYLVLFRTFNYESTWERIVYDVFKFICPQTYLILWHIVACTLGEKGSLILGLLWVYLNSVQETFSFSKDYLRDYDLVFETGQPVMISVILTMIVEMWVKWFWSCYRCKCSGGKREIFRVRDFGWNMPKKKKIWYNILCLKIENRFNARCWMLGAGALGRPRGMVWGGRREEGKKKKENFICFYFGRAGPRLWHLDLVAPWDVRS